MPNQRTPLAGPLKSQKPGERLLLVSNIRPCTQIIPTTPGQLPLLLSGPPPLHPVPPYSASGFFPQSPQAQVPGSHGHSPVSPPQLHLLLFPPSTAFMSLVSFSSAFLGQELQAHLPGSQGHAEVLPPQLQTVRVGSVERGVGVEGMEVSGWIVRYLV